MEQCKLKRPSQFTEQVIKLFEDEGRAEETAQDVIQLVRTHSGVDAAHLQWRVRQLIMDLLEQCATAEFEKR